MAPTDDRTDLPVLVLYNLDRTWPDQDILEVLDDVRCLLSALRALGHPVMSVPIYDADLITPLRPYHHHEYIVFNWCEELPGIPRSSAVVAQWLESLSFAYTGSPPHVLSLSDDRREIKKALVAHGVPTPQWRVYESAQGNGWDHFPAIVKPVLEHCSVGISSESVVTSLDELSHRVAYVLETLHQPALVEEFIDGREFHAALWGNGNVEMLPVAEMDFSGFSDLRDRLCTYDGKNNPNLRHDQQYNILMPASLGEGECRLLEQTGRAAYRALRCRDYARVDIRMRDGAFYVLDVNPNCYISAECTFVRAAGLAGYSYGAFGSRLVNLARHRAPTDSL